MVERKNESLIPNSPLEIPIDTGAPLRVFGVVSSLEQDHALLDEKVKNPINVSDVVNHIKK